MIFEEKKVTTMSLTDLMQIIPRRAAIEQHLIVLRSASLLRFDGINVHL
jgi:hypothetical protein